MENYLVMNTTDHVMLMNRVEYDTILRQFVPPAVPTCDRIGDCTLLAWNGEDWKLKDTGKKAFTKCLHALGMPYSAISIGKNILQTENLYSTENLTAVTAAFVTHPRDIGSAFPHQDPRALFYTDFKNDLTAFFNKNADLAEAVWDKFTDREPYSMPYQRTDLAVQLALDGKLCQPGTAYYTEMRDYLAETQAEYRAYHEARAGLKTDFGQLSARNRSLPEQFTMEYMTAHNEGRSEELLTATANLLKSGKYLASEIQTCLQKCAPERLLAHKPVYAAIQDGSYVKMIQEALGKNPSVQH